jgi:hypothetical protein
MTIPQDQNYNLNTMSDADMLEVAYKLNDIEPSALSGAPEEIMFQSAGVLSSMEGNGVMLLVGASLVLLFAAPILYKQLKMAVAPKTRRS